MRRPGVCQVWVVDEAAGIPSSYNAVQLTAGQEGGCSVSNVFPAPAGDRTYSVMVLSTAGATAWGAVSAVFIPYNGAGSSTPPAPARTPARVTSQQ